MARLYQIAISFVTTASRKSPFIIDHNTSRLIEATKFSYRTFGSSSTSSGDHSSTRMLDLSNLSQKISENEKRRQQSFDLASSLKVALAKIRHNAIPPTQDQENQNRDVTIMNSSSSSNEKETMVDVDLLVKKAACVDREMQPPSLFYAFQDYVKFQAYRNFLSVTEGQQGETTDNNILLPPSTFQSLSPEETKKYDLDEDYLMGIMGLTQDLARYSILRGTVRDERSITLARDLVQELLEFFLQFDFRNGMLRRKYDGVKYALKTCETVLYELSVTGNHNNGNQIKGNEQSSAEGPDKKRQKREESTTTTTTTTTNDQNKIISEEIMKELIELQKRIEHRDDVRETLIKKCRDAQKKAKNAIYSLHRNDKHRAKKLLEECESITKKDLVPIVDAEPSLRYGSSFGCVMEEYAEAKLFYAWLYGCDSDTNERSNDCPKCTLLQPDEIKVEGFPLSTEEYLGGLCDLTGEVGRYAVQRGTARDSAGVKLCLNTNSAILFSLETLERFPSSSGLGKKMEPLRRSVEKIERMLYELSLVEATGRNFVADSVRDDDRENEGR